MFWVADPIKIEEYNELWPGYFQEIRERLWPAIKDLATGIEHIGSTSVPGLAAKPIIDIDIIASQDGLSRVIQQLQKLGYEHLGDLGINSREAFRSPPGPIQHHLYVCLEGCLALRNHVTLRDHLRKNPTARQEYSAIKKSLAFHFGHSGDEYTQRKTEYIVSVLKAEGFEPEHIEAIHMMNTGGKAGDVVR